MPMPSQSQPPVFQRRVHCPRCNARMPVTHKPTTKRQILWGGWTCPQCRCEMDKQGREIDPQTGVVKV